MFKELVKKYINNLRLEDIKSFADSNNIKYTNSEALIVYQFIKENYLDLLNENINVFLKIKDKISKELYKDLLNLYIEYKQKYL